MIDMQTTLTFAISSERTVAYDVAHMGTTARGKNQVPEATRTTTRCDQAIIWDVSLKEMAISL